LIRKFRSDRPKNNPSRIDDSRNVSTKKGVLKKCLSTEEILSPPLNHDIRNNHQNVHVTLSTPYQEPFINSQQPETPFNTPLSRRKSSVNTILVHKSYSQTATTSSQSRQLTLNNTIRTVSCDQESADHQTPLQLQYSRRMRNETNLARVKSSTDQSFNSSLSSAKSSSFMCSIEYADENVEEDTNDKEDEFTKYARAAIPHPMNSVFLAAILLRVK